MILTLDTVWSSLKEYLHSLMLTTFVSLLEHLAALRSLESHNLHVNSVLWVYIIEMFAVKVMML